MRFWKYLSKTEVTFSPKESSNSVKFKDCFVSKNRTKIIEELNEELNKKQKELEELNTPKTEETET